MRRRPACERPAAPARACALALAAALVAGCILGCTLAGCALAAKAPPPDPDAADAAGGNQPTAIIRFGRRPALGTHGTIAGYISGWPFTDGAPESAAADPRFAYVIDFAIVETDYHGVPIKAAGTRRIYFHPRGVRVAFGDDSRLVNGEPIAIEQVNFTFEFYPDFSHVMIRMRGREISLRAFDYDGRSITPAALRDGSSRMLGRFSAVYGGFLLIGTGA